MPAEDASLHVEPGHEAMTPSELEAVAVADYEREVADQTRRAAEVEDDVAEALREEETLGGHD